MKTSDEEEFNNQSAYVKCFSPVWVRKCAARLKRRLAVYGHTLHAKGFSPVWVRMCAARVERWLAE